MIFIPLTAAATFWASVYLVGWLGRCHHGDLSHSALHRLHLSLQRFDGVSHLCLSQLQGFNFLEIVLGSLLNL